MSLSTVIYSDALILLNRSSNIKGKKGKKGSKKKEPELSEPEEYVVETMQSESEVEEEETSEESSEEETDSEEEEENVEEENVRGISDMSSYEGDDSFEESDSGDESSYEEVQEGKRGFLSKNRSGGRRKSFSTTKPTTFKPTMGLFNKKEQGKKGKKPLATTTAPEKSRSVKGMFSKKPAKKQVLHQKPVVGKKLSKAMQPGNQKNPFGVKKSPEVSKVDLKGKGKGKDKLLSKKKSKTSMNDLSTPKTPKTKKSLNKFVGLTTVGEKDVEIKPLTNNMPNGTNDKLQGPTKGGEPSANNDNNLVEQPQSNLNDASTKNDVVEPRKTLNPNTVANQTDKKLPPGRFISANDFASSSTVDIPGGLPEFTQPQIIGYYLFSNPSTPVKEDSPIEALQNSKESTVTMDGDNLTVSTTEGVNYSFKTKPFYSNELSNNTSESPLGKSATTYSSESNNIVKNIITDSSSSSSPLMTNSNEMKYAAQFQPTVAPSTGGQSLTLNTTQPIQNATDVVNPPMSKFNSQPVNDGFTTPRTPTTPSTPKPLQNSSSVSFPASRISSNSKPLVSSTEDKIAAMKARGVKRLPREASGAFSKRSEKDPTVPRSYKVKMGGMFGGRSAKPVKDKKALKEKEKRRSKIKDSIITSFS